MFCFKIFFHQEILQISKRKSYHFANIFSFIILLSLFQILTAHFAHDLSANLFIIFCNFAILSAILLINHVFLFEDFIDGTLEQIIIKCRNLEIMVLAKCLANWLCSCVPIIIIAGFFAKILYNEIFKLWQFSLLLACGSLSLFFLLALCGSLSMLRGSSSIISIIALPLTLPILIILNVAMNEDFWTNIKILLAITFFIIPICCLGIAKIIKIANDS